MDDRMNRLESRVSKLEDIVATLRSDVSEIKALIPTLATRADIAELAGILSTKIENAVGTLLKDALNAIPQRHALIWSAVSTVAIVAGTLVAMLK